MVICTLVQIVLHMCNMTKSLSLPALRRICGYTQVGLAKRIGVSTRTITAAENGTRALSGANARMIMFATGVLPLSLIQEDSPRALDCKPYTREHWNLWRKSSPSAADPRIFAATDGMRDALDLSFKDLLAAAADSGRIFLVAEEYRVMLGRLFKDPGIKRRYLELTDGAGGPEDFDEWINMYVLENAWELGETSRDQNQPLQPFAAIPGLDE